ncbi:hypothetical protein [Streptomyces sp. CB03238]|uniref:hypothetical protein n=1 Tax=Streptomyces sp. CB03238 TaxID=1907777 RepID=UPI000A1025D2|nr:hypothetical protein [Streptomyces sp. CB03238]ORT61931.1 hypothetical protein BKD26_02680 [Streptomyces sp. CB03238]
MNSAATRLVPYITARHGEEADSLSNLSLRPGGKGLFYLNEGPGDRDERGVLWARCSQSRYGNEITGRPRWRDVHPSRQRECMEDLRCQVCVQQPSRTAQGYLFLATQQDDRPTDSWEGHLTAQPPLCLEHAKAAVEQCGHLVRAGAVALRVRVPRLYGVIGVLYRTGSDGRPETVEFDGESACTPLPYRNRRLTPWFLASQLVRELRGVTVVDLEEEADREAYGRDRPMPLRR